MKKIVNIQDYRDAAEAPEGEKIEAHGLLAQDKWVALVDNAARGDLEAIADLAESYLKGTFGEKDLKKARKWCAYAAKKGHERAIGLLKEIPE